MYARFEMLVGKEEFPFRDEASIAFLKKRNCSFIEGDRYAIRDGNDINRVFPMSCWRQWKGLVMKMTLSESYSILERYYLLLDDTFQDSNVESFDVDSAYTKIELEKVLSEQPSLSIRGNSFLRELLSDDIGESVAEAIKIILEGGDNL